VGTVCCAGKRRGTRPRDLRGALSAERRPCRGADLRGGWIFGARGAVHDDSPNGVPGEDVAAYNPVCLERKLRNQQVLRKSASSVSQSRSVSRRYSSNAAADFSLLMLPNRIWQPMVVTHSNPFTRVFVEKPQISRPNPAFWRQ